MSFYLLHLSLMREYLDLEFQDIEAVLPFQYNLERVIDDFILLAVFVGNDFLPHLPDLHIHENGLEKLFDVYKKVLPGLGMAHDVTRRSLLTLVSSRWLYQREWVDKHEKAASRSGRDGIMGAGSIREGVFRHELVQGQAIKVCQGSDKRQETGGAWFVLFFFFFLLRGRLTVL